MLMIGTAKDSALLAEIHQAEQQETAQNTPPIPFARHTLLPLNLLPHRRNQPCHKAGDALPKNGNAELNFFLGY
jgi:hypothetical protein